MQLEAAIRIENANHDKVFYYIDKVLSDNPRYCRCHRCRLDVAALALNTLPPHYFVNPSHSRSEDLGSPWILIEMAVREAMDKVQLYPHHIQKELEATERSAPSFPFQPLKDTGTDG
ncbi:MAG TPA: late competence development ComFB family protein [Nitrospirota bacterium]|nr:late competence development ComFB family protein [Nitrospirota bacterium]